MVWNINKTYLTLEKFILKSKKKAQFLSKRFSLVGENEIEQTEVDMYSDQVNDLMNELFKAYSESNEIKKIELKSKLHQDIVPRNFNIFETKL